MELSNIIEFALTQNASDIHLSSNAYPIVRVNGVLKKVGTDIFEQVKISEILDAILPNHLKTAFTTQMEVDFAYSYSQKARFRVNAFQTIVGPCISMRLIPIHVKTFHELGTPKVIESLASLEKGLVLVTGPTGSGKSTTLAAMIDYINQNYFKHIITIEDPIEFVHTSAKSLVHQREVGANTESFAKALKSALREDPEIILVGEMRDLESIRLAITAAETGHLVFATLHTNSAAQTINRIVDVFPAGDKELVRIMLSTSLEGVISQRLLPKADNKGRVAAYEIMIATNAIKNLIKENKIAQIQSMIQVSSKDGMIFMQDYINTLIERGVVLETESLQVIRSAEESIKSLGTANATKPNSRDSDSEF
jgi:twitching motility protein PilT